MPKEGVVTKVNSLLVSYTTCRLQKLELANESRNIFVICVFSFQKGLRPYGKLFTEIC